MVALDDTVGAFVPGRAWSARRWVSGRLSGLNFAVKDLFDVAGSSHDLWQPGLGEHPPDRRSPPLPW